MGKKQVNATSVLLTAMWLVTVSASAVHAESMGWGLSISGSGNSWSGMGSDLGTETPLAGGATRVTGDQTETDWAANWQFDFDPDPGITGAFEITNTTASTAQYIVAITLPSEIALPAPTELFGSLSANLNTNLTGEDAELAALPGEPLYTAKIEGLSVGILGSNFLLQAPAGFTASSMTENFTSSTGPQLNLDDDLEILLQFTLTPGHTAQIATSFAVIPEPSSLLLIGGMALVVVRRR